jgi:hypothetical protein
MLRMNSLVRRLLNQFKGKVATPTNTNLNASPRQVSINEPRTTTMSDASAKGSSNIYCFAKRWICGS